ncbi:Crp/Fnr family transcriptional regulator [Bergeyella sp. RCAD1439]|uniref:Crp/Fnr family transcriptional regulator n=1 Tax=Bergeyella anatis TaxID=3113737 RepID=UPI002E17C844|nr:Crp/Fnr family transcriptional regulator [Bergeyella sp. RCAD1439]
MDNLSDYLSRVFNLPMEAASMCGMYYTSKDLKKGEVVLRSGEVCRFIYFVEKGLLRMYSVDRAGKEHIIQFAPENWMVSDRSSLYFNEKSFYYIDAVEDSRVLCLSPDFFLNLKKQYPDAVGNNDLILHKHIRNIQNRVNSLLAETAQERYLGFIRMYPNILQRVPQWMVASYLGITPESLSRVRKELVKK